MGVSGRYANRYTLSTPLCARTPTPPYANATLDRTDGRTVEANMTRCAQGRPPAGRECCLRRPKRSFRTRSDRRRLLDSPSGRVKCVRPIPGLAGESTRDERQKWRLCATDRRRNNVRRDSPVYSSLAEINPCGRPAGHTNDPPRLSVSTVSPSLGQHDGQPSTVTSIIERSSPFPRCYCPRRSK
uniref:Uncharacterized protein n=1 Tax=Plectus sambesii TaxID=2011161 RepID=A0A914UJE9_9BILA